MSIPLRSLRGSGPAPVGYYHCAKGAKCPAWRNPSTGRFGSSHFHPFYRCECCGEDKPRGYMARETLCIHCDAQQNSITIEAR